jgi:unsaturated rhamnogalacturonyl hydrolase
MLMEMLLLLIINHIQLFFSILEIFKFDAMKYFIILTAIIFTAACSSIPKETKNKPLWAVKFADAVMHRSDSLIYYDRDQAKYEYDYAFLGSAIDLLGEINPRYSAYMQAYIDYFVRDDGTIETYKLTDYNIDRVRPGLNMLVLYERTGKEKYRIAAETLVSQMENHPRTKSNGYWHKKSYPWQMWLDGIYMASPFLAKYAVMFDQPQWFDEIVFQIEHIYENTLDPNTGLLYHAWDESREQLWSNPETGQSKHFWSRATGWYFMALVDVLDYLPETHPGRPALIEILNKLSQAVMKVRDEDTGLWYQVLDMGGREGNYVEASGSAMIIYAFAKGAKKGYLPAEYFEIARESFQSLTKNLVTEGEDGYPVLTQTCGACGLGGNPYRMGDYEYYISEKQIDNDQKGVAPVIMAAYELNE